MLQETAAPEDMFDDLAGQGAPAPAAAAARAAPEALRHETLHTILSMLDVLWSCKTAAVHARLSSNERGTKFLQLLSCLQEDDAEIEELLAAAEAMPLTQPEDAAMAAAASLAPVTASQVMPTCYQCCGPATSRWHDLGSLLKLAISFHHCSCMRRHQHIINFAGCF